MTEQHLGRTQTEFIIAKAGTKVADNKSVTVAAAFAMFDVDTIAPVTDVAQDGAGLAIIIAFSWHA